MVEPSCLALTTTPSIAPSLAELTLPDSAAAFWAKACGAKAIRQPVEASNNVVIRIGVSLCPDKRTATPCVNICRVLVRPHSTAAVAQPVEHRIRNAGVGGSNPLRGTSLRKRKRSEGCRAEAHLGRRRTPPLATARQASQDLRKRKRSEGCRAQAPLGRRRTPPLATARQASQDLRKRKRSEGCRAQAPLGRRRTPPLA